MNCSNQTTWGWIAATAGALAASVTLCIIAGVMNASFWGAPGAPGVMAAALGTTLLAGGAMAGARQSFESFRQCVLDSTHGQCGSNLAQAHSAILGALAAIAAAVSLITGAIPVSWIPWAGEVPIGLALIGVIVASGAVALPSGYMYGAEACYKSRADVRRRTRVDA